MYKLFVNPDLFEHIKKLGEDFPSIINKIKILSENPNSIASNTEMEVFCKYYVNAGRHAILFDTNDSEEIVYIKYILLRARLYKILSGKLKAPTS